MQASGTGLGLAASQPVQLFVSYAHADRSFCLRLRKQLSHLVQQRLIRVWYDRDLQPGDEWNASAVGKGVLILNEVRQTLGTSGLVRGCMARY